MGGRDLQNRNNVTFLTIWPSACKKWKCIFFKQQINMWNFWPEDSMAQLALTIYPAFYFWKLQEACSHTHTQIHTHTQQQGSLTICAGHY